MTINQPTKTQRQFEAELSEKYPQATPAQVSAAVSCFVYRNVIGQQVLAQRNEADAEAILVRELNAIEWIQNNPTSALAVIQAVGSDLDELSCMLYAWANTYDEWANGPYDNIKRTGARLKATRYRNIAQALEADRDRRLSK